MSTIGMSPRLVGRAAELARLTAAVERARTGRPTAVLLAGDAGVGKTRLVTELCRQAREAGATVLVGHCVDLGAVGLPYLAFAEALRELAGMAGDGPLADAFRDRPALDRLITRPGRTAEPPTGDDDAGRLQLFDAVSGILADAADAGPPVLLVLEDLHWADQSTRDLLSFLLARLRSEKLAVVASYRADDLHRRHPLRPLLAELVRLPSVQRLELHPFTPAELTDYLRAVSGAPVPDRLVRDVLARSEGNAYFAEELLAAGLDGDLELPTGLADVLLSRLERLPAAVQRIARVAAVAGRRVGHPLLQAATGMSDAEVEEALREAVTHHVLVADTGAYRFRHALLQEAVYADLLPGERVRLHGTYARLFADGVESSAAELAYHSLESHDLPRALTASVQAATEATALRAPVEALHQLERALQLWEAVPDAAARTGTDLVALGLRASTMAAGAGELHRAVALAADARDRADLETPGGERAADAREVLALHLLGADRAEDAYEMTGQALEMVPAEPPTAVRVWAAATRARSAINLDKDEEGKGWAEEALAGARALDLPEAEADALASLALVAEGAGDPALARTRLAEARDRAAAAGDIAVELRATYNLAAGIYYAGELPTALTDIDAGVRRAAATGMTFSAYGRELRVLQVIARYVAGDWDASLEAAELAAADRAPDSALARLAAAALYVEVGRGLPGAAERATQLHGSWSQDVSLALVAGGCEIDLLTWQGDPGAAADAADRAMAYVTRRWDEWYLGGIWLAALGLAALADRVAGERLRGEEAAVAAAVERGRGLIARARTTAERGRPRHGVIGPEGLGWLARAEAEWTRLAGPSDPDAWDRAREIFEYGYPYEVARCRWRRAEALLGADRREEAAAEVAAAYEVAVRLGAAPLREALEALARRGRLEAGLPVPVRSDHTLTAREQDVLALLARGRTNRQIGRTLFISDKTASVHVSNILGKLGASGRTEAVAIASRRGLVPTGEDTTVG